MLNSGIKAIGYAYGLKENATKANYGVFITNKLITMRVKTDKAIVKVICESFIITF